MLASFHHPCRRLLHPLANSPGTSWQRTAVPFQQRRSLSFTLQTLSESFYDFALALPLPPSFPPYSTTIILTTVLSRVLFTLPVSIWAKKRQWRLETEVLPRLQNFKTDRLSKLRIEAQKLQNPFHSDREEYNKLKAAYLAAIATRRKELCKQYNCSILPTALLPAATQLPVFVGQTLFFGHLCARPTPFDFESFLTITSLSHPDPTAALPIALGLVSLANIETNQWFLDSAKLQRYEKSRKRLEEMRQKQIENGRVPMPTTNEVIRTTLRILSILRIVVGVMVDGAVVICWVTSAIFGLFQSWGFQWWERHRASRRIRLTAPAGSPKHISSPRKVA
ncbi:hypothetical protein BD410DRAFT_779991 [Rickenella mellea]|uniref:Uncharacterized protein n=1 Tax=Rickenella mellea TaxID=50990 RepID=A0A4R5XEM7_9AGAM|nr:hypothetical protein BD410DRAFT_779991 [Rickenella mellea]